MIQQRNDPSKLREQIGVSRETFTALEFLESELRRWQTRMNLISAATVDEIWDRHILDSLQLVQLEPNKKIWLDIGSGAGFPGLVVSLCKLEISGFEMHLVERDHRKCAFLREVARVTGAPVVIHNNDIATCVGGLPQPDVITSRAVAPVGDLIASVHAKLKNGATGLFMKGRKLDPTLTSKSISSIYRIDILPSITSYGGEIVRVQSRNPSERSS